MQASTGYCAISINNYAVNNKSNPRRCLTELLLRNEEDRAAIDGKPNDGRSTVLLSDNLFTRGEVSDVSLSELEVYSGVSSTLARTPLQSFYGSKFVCPCGYSSRGVTDARDPVGSRVRRASVDTCYSIVIRIALLKNTGHNNPRPSNYSN